MQSTLTPCQYSAGKNVAAGNTMIHHSVIKLKKKDPSFSLMTGDHAEYVACIAFATKKRNLRGVLAAAAASCGPAVCVAFALLE